MAEEAARKSLVLLVDKEATTTGKWWQRSRVRLQRDDGAYFEATKAAEQIVQAVGEQTAARGYHMGLAALDVLTEAVNRHFGERAFEEILEQSDCGNWQAVFGILRRRVGVTKNEP